MPATESALAKSMARKIRARGGWARKTHGGRFSSGLPDIIGCYRGYGLWLEVKLPGRERTLTTLQAAVLAEIKAAGGISRMVTSTVQVDRILDAIDRRRDDRVGQRRRSKAHKAR